MARQGGGGIDHVTRSYHLSPDTITLVPALVRSGTSKNTCLLPLRYPGRVPLIRVPFTLTTRISIPLCVLCAVIPDLNRNRTHLAVGHT
jgi:hypothetical protein